MNFYVIVFNSCANIDLGMTNTAEGYRYYQHFRQSFVKATQIRYVSRECCALWAAAGYVKMFMTLP